MSKKEVYEQKAEALLLPIIEANNFELVDVSLMMLILWRSVPRDLADH